MPKEKRFSIITPTYNRMHLLPRCIDSVLAQTYGNFEMVIVDDGSSDDTKGLVEEYVRKDDRIRLIAQSNRGANAARNHGVEIAEGEHVLFLDSDDEARPNWLENLDALITSTSSPVAACCGIEFRNAEGEPVASKQPADDAKGRPNGGCFNSGTYAVSRVIFQQLGGFSANLPAHQHSELRLRLFCFCREHGHRITSTSEILVNAYQHDGPNIRSNPSAKLEATKFILKHHRDKFEQNQSVAAWLASAGGCAAELKNYPEARRYFCEACKTYPRKWKNYLRFGICLIPGIRSIFWRNTGN
jgi:glycosyltransferase involved in cell wall biosynthesis